jgi:DNA-binding ferritin-like protein
MKNSAITLRALHLVSHNYHNLTAGQTFFADHGFFGDVYTAAGDAYDSVIERCVGMHDYGPKELSDINEEACSVILKFEFSNTEHAFQSLQVLEKFLCNALEDDMKTASEGTKNLLAQLADDSEVRQYKLKQRLKK